jgi:hypothetical protein
LKLSRCCGNPQGARKSWRRIHQRQTARGEDEKVMTNPFLKLEMQGTEFVITMPGTSYQVTFRQLADYQGFSASHIMEDDPDAPITRSEFLARAWRVANDKVRELGWIV